MDLNIAELHKVKNAMTRQLSSDANVTTNTIWNALIGEVNDVLRIKEEIEAQWLLKREARKKAVAALVEDMILNEETRYIYLEAVKEYEDDDIRRIYEKKLYEAGKIKVTK
jgi:hypothetical protein